MPLHDWRVDRGWDSVHLVWLAQLLDWVQPRLPAGYRAYVGSAPALTIDVPNGRPDLSVRQWPLTPPAAPSAAGNEPDDEAVATFSLDPQRALHIDLRGQLIAAFEIVSPRNKDSPAARPPLPPAPVRRMSRPSQSKNQRRSWPRALRRGGGL